MKSPGSTTSDRRRTGLTWRVFPIAWLLLLATVGCGRKDVHRDGRIKLRGEKPISVDDKRSGALLQKGLASWYGEPFHGRRTSNGEVYDMHGLTAAHKTLPFDTFVKVVNRDNGKSVVVRINDRGPFIAGRVIDLSRGAAVRLDLLGPGTAPVSLYLTERSEPREPSVGEHPLPELKPSGGFWAVQVGSFSEHGRGKAMARRLRDYHRRVWTEKYRGMLRVRAGEFETKAEAAVFAQKLNDDGIDSWLVFVER